MNRKEKLMDEEVLFGLYCDRENVPVFVTLEEAEMIAQGYRYKLVVLDSGQTIRVRATWFDTRYGVVLKDWEGQEHIHTRIIEVKEKRSKKPPPPKDPYKRKHTKKTKAIARRMSELFCINNKCKLYEEISGKKLKIHGYYKTGSKEVIRVRCRVCGKVFSENKIRKHKA